MGFLLSWLLTTDVAMSAALPLFLFITYRTLVSSRAKFPPGPRPFPIIGNVLQIPTESLEETFTEWKAQYGDIVYIKIFKQPMVIINDLQAARDLLDKRSSIYSDRPRFVLLSELMGWSSASTHMRYGPRFRKHRRFINQAFNQRAISAFRPLQEKEILVLLEGMQNNPNAFVDHIRRFAAATILKITYGHDIVSVDDLFVQLAERAGTLTVEAGSPAANMVDFFPIMRHIPTWAPFSTFKIKALETRKAVEAMMHIPFEQVVAEMKSGTAVPSYTSMLLDSHRDSSGSISPEDEEDIRGSAGTLFAGKQIKCSLLPPTISAMHTFLQSMLLYPHEFKKVQDEIDIVVGRNRLPNIDDRPSLPYLECVLKEVVRMNPMVPLGMPHRLMEDDFYRDFYIPEGTNVLANIYAILRDCPNSDSFCPERYLQDDGLPDPLGVIFGFGRRICPGRHLAETSYWAIAANIVAAFDISKALDERGNDMNSSYGFTTGFVRHPKPFKCTIKPRSSNLTNLISQARAELASQGPYTDIGILNVDC
ncbi:cytochrome P450 [Pholiota conissans]|uniref:Cytochrome P450 n=1 Tax=Pholiota conissans TaxID=109636 RepID=A0A9P6CZP9_9AGAR|nr:cytochrome P450 [Pholiota conissans]